MFVGHPILEEIKQGFKLRPTVTIDKSKPMFRAEGEKEVAIRYEKRDPPPMPVFAPPPPPPPSAPPPKPVVNLQSSKRAALLNKLSATSGTRVDRDALLKSIQSGVQLRKTTVNDRSGLFVDEDLLADLRGSSRPTTPNSISSMDSSCQGAPGASTSGYDSDNSIAPPTARFGPKPPAPVFAPPPPPPPAAPPPKPVVNLQSSKRAALLNKLSNVRAVPFDRDALLKSIQSGVQLRKAAGVQDKSGLIVDEEMMSDLRRSNIPSSTGGGAATTTSSATPTPSEPMPTPICTINVNAPPPPPPPLSSMPPPLLSSAAAPPLPTANGTSGGAPVKKRRVVKKASVDGTTGGKKTKKAGAKKAAAGAPPPPPPPPAAAASFLPSPTAAMSALNISPPQSGASSAAASPSASSTQSVSTSSQASPQSTSTFSSTKSGRLSSASSGIGTTSEASSVTTETRKKWPTVEPVLPAQYAERPKKPSDIIFEERNLRVTKEDIDSEIPAGSAAARIAALRKMESAIPVIKAPLPSDVGGRLAATKEPQPASAVKATLQSSINVSEKKSAATTTTTKSSQKPGTTTTKPSAPTTTKLTATTSTANGISKPKKNSLTTDGTTNGTTTSGSKTDSKTGLKTNEAPPPLPTSAPPPLRHSTKITLGAGDNVSSRIVQKSVASFGDEARKTSPTKKSSASNGCDSSTSDTAGTTAESRVERLRKSFNDRSTTRL